MTNNEVELIELIRCHKSPERAIDVAVGIILDYLKQHGSSEGQSADDLQEPA